MKAVPAGPGSADKGCWLSLVDHFVGECQQSRWHDDTQRLCGFDHQTTPSTPRAALLSTGSPARVVGMDLVVRRRAEAVLRELRTEIAKACLEMADKRDEPPLHALD